MPPHFEAAAAWLGDVAGICIDPDHPCAARGLGGPLDEVPDPVFAERLLGDGIAIDPTGSVLHAPCAGQIISVHHSRHAVTLRADNGAELLLHIGLETVAIGGDGFEAHVADGHRVNAGDRLVSFDLNRVAMLAKSLITPVIVTNGDAFTITSRGPARLVGVDEPLFKLVSRAAEVRTTNPTSGSVSRVFTVRLAHGVHARPAAVVSNAARGFDAAIELGYGAKRADARSAVAVMALGLTSQAEVEIVATGRDAEAAIAALVPLFAAEPSQPGYAGSGTVSGHGVRAADASTVAVAAPLPPWIISLNTADSLSGVTAAPGLAIGTAFRLVRALAKTGIPADTDVNAETAALAGAIASVRARLTALTATGPAAQRGIMAAHLTLLDDPEVNEAAVAELTRGKSAAAA